MTQQVLPQDSPDIPFLFRSDVQTLTQAPAYSAEPRSRCILAIASPHPPIAQAAKTTQQIKGSDVWLWGGGQASPAGRLTERSPLLSHTASYAGVRKRGGSDWVMR